MGGWGNWFGKLGGGYSEGWAREGGKERDVQIDDLAFFVLHVEGFVIVRCCRGGSLGFVGVGG